MEVVIWTRIANRKGLLTVTAVGVLADAADDTLNIKSIRISK